MFSEKTGALLRLLCRSERAHREVVAIKPKIDDRYEPEMICSHDGGRRHAVVVDVSAASLSGILEIGMRAGVTTIGIDEAQFFPLGLLDVCLAWQSAGREVIWAGLDMDYRGLPFGPVPGLMAVGTVQRLTAVCVVCGADATHSHRKEPQGGQVVVGAAGLYEPRCYSCWRRHLPT